MERGHPEHAGRQATAFRAAIRPCVLVFASDPAVSTPDAIAIDYLSHRNGCFHSEEGRPPSTSDDRRVSSLRVHALAGYLARRPLTLSLSLIAAWVLLHLAFAQIFIFHDSWKHGFPLIFAIVKQSQCWGLPGWFGMVDNGSPLIIYLISLGLTQVVLVPFVYLMGCMHPDVATAMLVYKTQIYLSYLVFSCGMYVLGRALFRHPLSAVYLLAATLFAGMCLDNAHSSQIVNIVFWTPWILICFVLALREASGKLYFLYLNAAVLLICAQLLDQYPHFIALVLLLAGLLFLFLGSPGDLAPAAKRPAQLLPAAIVLVITGVHLLIIRSAIADYAPSLRSDLAVNPVAFSETGFLQPTALIGTLFPLSFLGGFEVFADGMAIIVQKLRLPGGPRWSIFRLDALLVVLGVIPILFAIAFFFSNANRRLRIGLALFTGVMCLISLQQTRLYAALFHLPFFDLFRSYFLYTIFAVFGLLLMSGHGVDRLLICSPDERRHAVGRAILSVGVLAILLLAAMIILFVVGPKTPRAVRDIISLLVVDVAFLVASLAVFARLGTASDPSKAIILLLALGTGLQMIVTAESYRLLGLTAAQTYDKFGLQADDEPAESRDYPASLDGPYRKQCLRFSQCYLSWRPTVSLNADLDGTFLRHRDEPVFQRELGDSVVRGLTGLSRPVAWLSQTASPQRTRREAASVLAAHSADLDDYLRRQVLTYEPSANHDPETRLPNRTMGMLRLLSWEADRVKFAYSSESQGYLVAAINHDKNWSAVVSGEVVKPLKANLGNLAIPLPAGRGHVELSYSNPYSDSLLYSRLVLVLLALGAVVCLARRILRSPVPHEP
jgi:hypothetical protein